jgi:hypothetical protein
LETSATTAPGAPTGDPRRGTDRPRLVFPPHPAGPAGVDGHWWPRTHDLAVELPALVAAVAQRFGAVDRVSADPEAWEHRPRSVVVGGREVLLDWFGSGQRHVLGLFGAHASHLELLVIPPGTAPVVALACLMMQPRPGPRPSTNAWTGGRTTAGAPGPRSPWHPAHAGSERRARVRTRPARRRPRSGRHRRSTRASCCTGCSTSSAGSR